MYCNIYHCLKTLVAVFFLIFLCASIYGSTRSLVDTSATDYRHSKLSYYELFRAIMISTSTNSHISNLTKNRIKNFLVAQQQSPLLLEILLNLSELDKNPEQSTHLTELRKEQTDTRDLINLLQQLIAKIVNNKFDKQTRDQIQSNGLAFKDDFHDEQSFYIECEKTGTELLKLAQSLLP